MGICLAYLKEWLDFGDPADRALCVWAIASEGEAQMLAVSS